MERWIKFCFNFLVNPSTRNALNQYSPDLSIAIASTLHRIFFFVCNYWWSVHYFLQPVTVVKPFRDELFTLLAVPPPKLSAPIPKTVNGTTSDRTSQSNSSNPNLLKHSEDGVRTSSSLDSTQGSPSSSSCVAVASSPSTAAPVSQSSSDGGKAVSAAPPSLAAEDEF